MSKRLVCLALCVLLLAMIAKTEAESEPKYCPCKNTKEKRFVCGSDNKTYGNLGQITCKNKCDGTNISVLHYGKCV